MRLVTEAAVNEYLRSDRILQVLEEAERPGDEALCCQRWLKETPAKRMIFEALYGDLISGARRNVLDVGGGLTSMTRLLARRHNYTLLDLMAHDERSRVEAMIGTSPQAQIVAKDWYAADLAGSYDIVIANDLFPNVDQRLTLFLDSFLSRGRELRFSLTYYNEPRFYFAKRLDASEILCVSAWDGGVTRTCLEKYRKYIVAPNLDILSAREPGPFANRRQVCLVTLRGETS